MCSVEIECADGGWSEWFVCSVAIGCDIGTMESWDGAAEVASEANVGAVNSSADEVGSRLKDPMD